jgi:hypothetical protein
MTKRTRIIFFAFVCRTSRISILLSISVVRFPLLSSFVDDTTIEMLVINSNLTANSTVLAVSQYHTDVILPCNMSRSSEDLFMCLKTVAFDQMIQIAMTCIFLTGKGCVQNVMPKALLGERAKLCAVLLNYGCVIMI